MVLGSHCDWLLIVESSGGGAFFAIIQECENNLKWSQAATQIARAESLHGSNDGNLESCIFLNKGPIYLMICDSKY